MEASLVKRAGIAFESIPAAGIHGVGLRRLPANLARLAQGFRASGRIIRRYQPDVLLLTGGYVGVPVSLAARRTPKVVYIPDIEPGLALRLLSNLASVVTVTAKETREHLPARFGALAAILFGLWMLKDFFLPDLGWRLQAPSQIGATAREMAKKATVPALIVGGFLIGLCTVPCSGAVYLGVLSLLALQPSALLGYSYLVLYNLIFVLPLVVILIAASARPTLNRLAHWNLHHKEWVRLVLGGGVVVMGLLILATV